MKKLKHRERKPKFPEELLLNACTECGGIIMGGLCTYGCEYDDKYMDARFKRDRRPKSKVRKLEYVLVPEIKIKVDWKGGASDGLMMASNDVKRILKR
jgi:hypothetical protein